MSSSKLEGSREGVENSSSGRVRVLVGAGAIVPSQLRMIAWQEGD